MTSQIIKAAMSSALAVTLTVGASSAGYAQVSDTSVVNSGDDAHVSSTTNNATTVKVQNSNTAQIQQKVVVDANTGGNSASGNIGGSSITTGDALVSANLSTVANKNLTTIDAFSAGTGANSVDIVNTGDDAHVSSTHNTQNNVGVVNKNYAVVKQDMYTKANTGYNKADGNIGGTTHIHSGDVGVVGNLKVLANENLTAVQVGPHQTPLSSSTVTNTGDGAKVHTNTTSKTNVKVYNSNAAYVQQQFKSLANTGKNSASGNIGEGTAVYSGNVGVLGYLHTLANKNTTAIGGSENGIQLNLSDVVNTGDDIQAHSNSTNKVSYSVYNSNKLKEYQALSSKTNTGYNKVNGNIGTSLATSGTALSGVELESAANSNASFLGSISGGVLALLANL